MSEKEHLVEAKRKDNFIIVYHNPQAPDNDSERNKQCAALEYIFEKLTGTKRVEYYDTPGNVFLSRRAYDFFTTDTGAKQVATGEQAVNDRVITSLAYMPIVDTKSFTYGLIEITIDNGAPITFMLRRVAFSNLYRKPYLKHIIENKAATWLLTQHTRQAWHILSGEQPSSIEIIILEKFVEKSKKHFKKEYGMGLGLAKGRQRVPKQHKNADDEYPGRES